MLNQNMSVRNRFTVAFQLRNFIKNDFVVKGKHRYIKLQYNGL